ncbi:MAG TPA: universal stress protein, partial [Candidatus Obscuribacterales bacterium]
MLKTILVALDGSDLSQRVMQCLEELQLQPATKIVLSHVISSSGTDVEVAVDRPHGFSEELPYREIEKKL